MGARSIAMPCARQFVLLSPAEGASTTGFSGVTADRDEFRERLSDMQRLRGSIYVREGAINESELTSDGRHEMPGDNKAWHLLLVGTGNRVLGCIRYLLHRSAVRTNSLGVASSALAQSTEWGGYLKKALHLQLQEAAEASLGFAEIGGWALADELRASAEGIRIVLATYGLAKLLGDALGVSTATMRNGSAKILRRLGGQSMKTGDVELPPYFDPQYNCEMEILRFDSRKPNGKYAEWIDVLQSEVQTSRVICATPATASRKIFTLGASSDLEHRI